MNFKTRRRKSLLTRSSWKTLAFCCSISSVVGFSSGLITGKIQVKSPRALARFTDTKTACFSLQDESAPPTNTGDHSGPSTKHVTKDAAVRQRLQRTDYASYEEKERREMEWIVRNTEKILGQASESAKPGTMSDKMIQLTLSLMRAWARRASKKESRAPHVVERLLRRLLEEVDAGNSRAVIDTSVYNIVLDGWSNSSEEGSADRSERILMQMERMYEQGNLDVKPNEGSYNAVIKSYVKNGSRLLAASKVESIVNSMEKPGMSVRPNRRSYNLLLYALANSSLEDAAARAEAILQKMVDRFVETHDESAKPDINSFNQVLGAWARGKQVGYEKRLQSVYEQLLKLPANMDILPNTDTFNAVMGGWLKSDRNNALSHIEETLHTMERSYESGNLHAKPDRITINTLNAAYAKNGNSRTIEKSMTMRSSMEAKYQIRPDTISHNIVVDSWCKSGREDAPEQAMGLLNSMERGYKNGKTFLKPDGYTYSSVIGCFVKFERENAPQKGEELLARMEDLYRNYGGDPVTTSVYNAAINAWASSGSRKGLIRVKELLQKMDGNDINDPAIPKPSRITFNTVIKAMRGGTAEDAAFAEQILTVLESRGRYEPHLLPDSFSYTSVITAYGRSDAEDKGKKSLEILQRMVKAVSDGNMAATPTAHSFNAALNACAFVNGSRAKKYDAFETAMKVYKMHREMGQADHTTYGTLLRACATLLDESDPSRQQLVDEFFRKACEDGSVGRLVITQMKFASTPEQHLLLTGRSISERIHPKELPKAWTRNVRENSRRSG